MQRDRLLFGLAAVFAGIATVTAVAGFAYSPVAFAVAVPFAAAAYLVWYQASGRLRERVESGRAGSYRRAGTDPRTETDRGGFGAGPRDSFSGRSGFGARDARSRAEAGGRARTGRRASAAGRARTGGRRPPRSSGPTPAEAYRVLGLDADADAEAVRRAYRRKVKSVHPDRESGDEEEFKRVTEAYEVLNDRD